MIRALFIAALFVSACYQPAPQPAPKLPQHFHTRADPPWSCEYKCAPWACTQAFDINTQNPGECTQAEHPAYCLCELK